MNLTLDDAKLICHLTLSFHEMTGDTSDVSNG